MATQDVTALNCTHEVADMLPHTKLVSLRHSVIMIKSSDTHVEVLALHHSISIEACFFIQELVAGKDRLIDITASVWSSSTYVWFYKDYMY